ncbi:MAG: hypothetical protein GXO62_00035 [Epsilonproteobacteria bacterium]|nr:hypothetical protein [Campylobacterota bacterium]
MDTKSIEFKLDRVEKFLNLLYEYKREFDFKYGIPVRAEVSEDIEEDKRLREIVDLLILNYFKAKSIIAEKIFKEILEFVGFDINKSFVEILNLLEKEGILEIKEWRVLRELRNNFSHEYPEEVEEMAQNLNMLFENLDILNEVFYNLKNYYLNAKKGLDENRNNV